MSARPPAARIALRARPDDHAGLVAAALAGAALRARLPGLELRDDAPVAVEGAGGQVAFRGRAIDALPIVASAPERVERSRRRMAIARAGRPAAASWHDGLLVDADGAPCDPADGLDVLALAEEAAPGGAPPLVGAALGRGASDAAPEARAALDDLLDEALAAALAAAWAAAGLVDPGRIALAERRAAEVRAEGDREGAALLAERLRRSERDARAALDDRATEVATLQRLLRDAQDERDAARATVEALLAGQAAAPVPDGPAEPAPTSRRFRRLRRG